MNTLTLNKVLLNAKPLNMKRRIVKDKDFYYKVLDREFTFSITAGGKRIKSSTATITKLKGNSVVWNQLWDINGDNRTDNIADMTINEREVVLTIQSIGTHGRIRTAYTIGVVGHKYYVTYQAKYNSKSDDSSLIAFVNMSNSYANQLPLTNSYQTYSDIWVGDYAGPMNVGVIGTRNDGDIVSFKDIKVIDLTQLFQAGNEPTTIEEYEARKPIVEDEYAYNEGEVIHMTAEGINSVGDNAFNGVWYQGAVNENSGQPSVGSLADIYTDTFRVIGGETYCSQFDGADLYLKGYFFDKSGAFIGSSDFDVWQGTKKWVVPINADSVRMRIYNAVGNITPSQAPNVMISLVHSGWKQDTDAGYQPYWEDRLIFDQRIKDEFPDGMSKWDMAYNKNNKGHVSKGMRVVDLGSLNWYYDASLGGYYSDMLVGVKKLFDGICAKYPFVGDYRNVTDKTCGYVYEECVLVKDSSYTDAASLKESLQGVPLYYELAEPTIIEYDEPFNLDYRVADFGTEQAIAETNSAPISAEIGYHILKNNLELTLNS